MAREEDEDDGLSPLGERTDRFLDQSKKGRTRNFLLVCKGNTADGYTSIHLAKEIV